MHEEFWIVMILDESVVRLIAGPVAKGLIIEVFGVGAAASAVEG